MLLREDASECLLQRLPGSLTHAKGTSNGRQDELGIAQGRQIDEDDPVAERALQVCTDLEGKARLARPPGTRQGHQPDFGLAQQSHQVSEFLLSADQRGEGRWERTPSERDGSGVGEHFRSSRRQEGQPICGAERKRIREHAHGTQVWCAA